MSARGVTVDCDRHGPMVRDEPRMSWKCPRPGCRAHLTDAEAYRLLSAAPARGPDPVPIIVTWAP